MNEEKDQDLSPTELDEVAGGVDPLPPVPNPDGTTKPPVLPPPPVPPGIEPTNL